MQHAARVLGIGAKDGHYDPEVAKRAVAGSVKDQLQLRRYNIGDIKLTEKMYDKRRGHMPNHPHMGVATELSCNQCGSTKLEPAGEYTAQVLVYPAYRCTRCGAPLKDRKSCGRVAYTAGIR
jgi:ribosomal protein S27AE